MKRPVGRDLLHQRQRDVIDRHAAFRLALLTAMGMAMEHSVQRETIERLFQVAAAEKWINFQRLICHGCFNWCVMQQSKPMLCPQSRESRLELESLLKCFMHELLNDLLTPG